MSQGRLESFGCDSSRVRFYISVHAGATLFAFLSSLRSMNSIDDDDEVFSSNKSIDVSILTCVEMLWRVMAGL